jgi:hypothetical protein
MWGKVLKNKNFLFLINNNKNSNNINVNVNVMGIVESLYQLRRNYFTNELMYNYHRKYVIPKLSLVLNKNEYVVKYDDDYYKYVNQLYVILSKSYMLLYFRKMIYRRPWYKNDDDYNLHSEKNVGYLYGFNNDGLLFVNKVYPVVLFDYTIPQVVGYRGNIAIYTTNDDVIYRVLGYKYDVGDSSEVIVNEEGVYRVQGEILLNTLFVNGVEDYYRRVIDSLESQLRGYIHSVILDIISSVLINMRFNIGFSRTPGGLPEISLIDIRRRRDNTYSKLKYLAYELIDNLKTVMEIDSYKIRLNDNGDIDDIRIHSQYYGDLIIEFLLGRIRYGNVYGDVLIRLLINNDGLILNELKADLYNQLRKLQRSTFNHVIGNHKITITNALSSEITYTPPIRTQILSTTPIHLSDNYYYVDDKSEVIVTHNEHGITKIKFTKPTFISFGVTDIDRTQYGESNRILLDMLVKRWSYRPFKLVYQN